MKKSLWISAVFLLIALFALPVSARVPRVVDSADLLTASEEAALEANIQTLTEKYAFDVVILFTDSIGGASPQAYADDYFDYNDYGCGSGRDGILLLVSLAESDWYISTSGAGIQYFSDASLDKMGKNIRPYLSDGNFYAAAERFLSDTEAILENGADSFEKSFPWMAELVVTVISLALAFVIAGQFKRALNTVPAQHSAAQYSDPNGADLKIAKDTYLYSTVTKVKVETEPSSGGRSHTHTSSSGRSHGGRGGKF